MKALIVGLGSMGKRRIRNLRHLGIHNITGYDIRPDRRQEAHETYGIALLESFDWDMVSAFDFVIISTPPQFHIEGAIECAKRHKHFFTELNFVRRGFDDLVEILKHAPSDLVAAPSCTLRFHPCIQKIRELVHQPHLGKPLCFIHHFGEYLPYWHPWESLDDFYVGQRESGGARDIVAFDLEFLTWLFGTPIDVRGFGSGTGTLGVDIDDNFQYVVKFASGVNGSVLVDVLQRKPNRYFRLVTEFGTIIWDDWDRQRLQVIYEKQPKLVGHDGESAYVTEELDLSGDELDWSGSGTEKPDFSSIMYIKEMMAFLHAIQGIAPYPKTFFDDQELVSVLYKLDANHGEG